MLDFCVISSGGTGCSAFLDFCNRNLKKTKTFNSARDADGLKHTSFHNYEKNKTKFNKIIYIMNDPLVATESLFRRCFFRPQIKKLLGDTEEAKTVPIGRVDFYKKTKQLNREILGFEKQIDFLSQITDKPILFINFNDILEKKELISQYLDIPTDVWRDFYIKKRNSNKDNILNNPNIPKEIISIYEKLNDKYNQLNGVILNENLL